MLAGFQFAARFQTQLEGAAFQVALPSRHGSGAKTNANNMNPTQPQSPVGETPLIASFYRPEAPK